MSADLWDAALAAIGSPGGAACLLTIVERRGSAPNGPGAKMLLGSDGRSWGTVGGGVAEHQLLERARQLLVTPGAGAVCVTLHHDAGATGERSGMICGGVQTYVLLRLDARHRPALESLRDAERAHGCGRLRLSATGLAWGENPLPPEVGAWRWDAAAEGGWLFEENVGIGEHLTIVGGGHVALALSRVAVLAGFRVTVLDDRPDVETMRLNEAAHEKKVIDYARVNQHVPEGAHSYVCITTHGYRTDRDVLAALLGKPLRYLGMLGSARKVRQVMDELAASGVERARLDSVHAPVGVPIGSVTPEEIAISITADLIRARRLGDAAR